MKIKKLICAFLCVLFLCSTTIMPSANQLVSATDMQMYEDYAVNYLTLMENYTPEIIGYKVLLDVETDEPTAIEFSFNGGYIIIGMNNLMAYQHSLSASSPYSHIPDNYDLYYNGHLEYYYKKDGKFIYTYDYISSSSRNANSNGTTGLSEMDSMMPDSSVTDYMTKTEKLNNVKAAIRSRSTTVTRSLTNALSISYINGLCGPTSAFNMLNYKGRVDRSNGQSNTRIIQEIADYTEAEVTLDTLYNGINDYLDAKNISGSVSCTTNYRFSLVESHINNNNPIILGTSAHGASAGHVQTIHGYTYTDYSSYIYYMLRTNDAHGRNGVVLDYENTPPTYFSDLVFYTS